MNKEAYRRNVHDRLIALAEYKKLSPEELCRKAGVSSSYIDNIVGKGITPRDSTLKKFCEVLGLDVVQFLTIDIDSHDQIAMFYGWLELKEQWDALTDEQRLEVSKSVTDMLDAAEAKRRG